MIKIFNDIKLIKQDDQATLDKLREGEIDDLQVSQKMPIDAIVRFGLDEGFLQKGLKSFPDPRVGFDIPVDILLLPSILQRLDDEHSLVNAPYMLNSADLLARLGYSPKIMKTGFNDKNKGPRKTIFHGEALKHVLLQSRPDDLLKWFNEDWNNIVKENAPGRTNAYIIDGTELLLPANQYKKYEGAGVVKKSDGTYHYGYKLVWIQEIIDRKLIIRAMQLAPIQDHDLKIGKELLAGFEFEKNATLIMDRGFFDLKWIAELKQKRDVNVVIPLKSNADVIGYSWIENKDGWDKHPTRKEQWIKELSAGDLSWDDYSIFKKGVVIKFKDKKGNDDFIYIVTTNEKLSFKNVLSTYELRFEIEECHRQMKCFQGLEKLPSKKYIQVVFRVIMGSIAYNLFNLFLNSENCETFKDYTLKTLRQKRIHETNPEVIIYTGDTFTIMRLLSLFPIILPLEKDIRDKLILVFQKFSDESS